MPELTPHSLDANVATNKLAKLLYDSAAQAVSAAHRAGEKASDEVFAAYELAQADLHRSVVALVTSPGLETLQAVETADGTLLVNSITYGKVPASTVLNRTATPVTIVLTSDGNYANYNQWHQGPVDGEAVFYERYTAEGRIAHGWIDADTRKLVQTG